LPKHSLSKGQKTTEVKAYSPPPSPIGEGVNRLKSEKYSSLEKKKSFDTTVNKYKTYK